MSRPPRPPRSSRCAASRSSSPGVLALDDVDFTLRGGEVHTLMGENGAGKSTLIKALTGVYTITDGTITVGGQQRTIRGTADAQAAGISTVYQEVNLCTNLSVGENVMLGHEVRNRVGAIDWKATHREAARHLAGLGLAHRHPHAADQPLDRHPAARRHQPRDGHRRDRARARRAHLEPRPRRGRAALRRHPRPARARRRHPLRHPLPRPGLRDLRPPDGAAQRQARRRVPGIRTAPRRAHLQDDRPGARRARRPLPQRRPRDRPRRGPRAARHRHRPQGRARAGGHRRLRRRGRRDRGPARLRPHGTRPAALRSRPRGCRADRGARCGEPASRAPATPSTTASPSRRRTAARRASSAT